MLRRLFIITGILLIFYSSITQAADAIQYSDEDLEVSYLYAAVLGTGTYQIKGRKLTMLRLPFNWSNSEADNELGRLRWLLPVVLGYDDLNSVESDIIDALLPDNLVTLTILPGVEYLYPVTSNWQLKPFVQAGAGRDFSIDETIYMVQLGLRSLYLTELNEKWELRWGNTFRWAAEYQIESGDRLDLSIFETGIDVRREIPNNFIERKWNVGAYYIFQRLIPQWTSVSTPDYKSVEKSLHEVGISIGLKAKNRVLGFNVQRLRVGYKKGDDFEGWTLGTQFPF
ncbi:MAG: hypothetical protein ACN4GR_04770 [Arenicellales bacterium]